MGKNIIVMDENGKQYEATWPKRAKGLVKSGRARFIDDNTICLTCPPDRKTEGNHMSENNNKLTLNYVLEQIEHIANDTEYLYQSIEALKEVTNATVPGDETGHFKAHALSNLVTSREQTNRELLATYTMMFRLLTDSSAN